MGRGTGSFLPTCFIPIGVVTFFLLLLLLASTTLAISSNETDRQALLEFKSKVTNDPLDILSSWNDSVHFCDWHGVSCGHKHQRVTILNLGSSKLSGSISPYIGNLSLLRGLDLSNNSFRGGIPTEIGGLRRLMVLPLNNNSLAGEIPSNLSGCSNLLVLTLAANRLTGEIPAGIGSLSKLEFLTGGSNFLTGSIPASLGNLSSLDVISLGDNFLGGSIPSSLGQLRNLRILELNSNNFSGVLPSSIFNLSFITEMEMGGNHIEGHLPDDLFITLPNVQSFSVAVNQYIGFVPSSMSNASMLEFIQLEGNKLTGQIPDLKKLNKLLWFDISFNQFGTGGLEDLEFLRPLTNATGLRILRIGTNRFGGTFQGFIGNMSSNLQVLYVGHNQISGSIPDGIGNLVNLQEFRGWSNKLTGTIPETIGSLQNLQELYLAKNKLTGNIPSSFGNLSKLNTLFLSFNQLHGAIPSSLGGCNFLQTLELSFNNLNGTLPVQILRLPSLSIHLGLSHNNLTSSIPVDIGNLVSLNELDLSNNKLSGEIPSALGSCTSLVELGMQGNLLRGSIPSSLGSLRGLEFMDLSHNNLSGQIPKFFTTFPFLLYLNLSFNELEGKVPIEGVFKNATATSVVGNRKLCGGIPEFHLPACNFPVYKKKKLRIKLKIILGTILSLLGVSSLLLLFLKFLIIIRKRKKREAVKSCNEENAVLKLSYWDLHKATGGFSSENLVGVGSFGFVYKGTLNTDGFLIAVKVINLQHQKAMSSFMSECEALRNIRHRNLVKVLTVCSSIDIQGNDFKALVYEFMLNGNLEEWLHPPSQDDVTSEARKFLTLQQRLSIAIDVASALEYLHFQCDSPIVHCDLKPSNILLDDELVGHVSDFGLAKFSSKGVQNIPLNESSSIRLRGTIGYAPPEYGLGNEISTSGDVYSFGITLLEMFTGKRPTNDMFREGLNLHKLAEKSLSDGVAEIIDPTLIEEIGKLDARRNLKEKAVECLTSIVKVGVVCSSETPEERMSISEITTRLCSIRNKLMGQAP